MRNSGRKLLVFIQYYENPTSPMPSDEASIFTFSATSGRFQLCLCRRGEPPFRKLMHFYTECCKLKRKAQFQIPRKQPPSWKMGFIFLTYQNLSHEKKINPSAKILYPKTLPTLTNETKAQNANWPAPWGRRWPTGRSWVMNLVPLPPRGRCPLTQCQGLSRSARQCVGSSDPACAIFLENILCLMN